MLGAKKLFDPHETIKRFLPSSALFVPQDVTNQNTSLESWYHRSSVFEEEEDCDIQFELRRRRRSLPTMTSHQRELQFDHNATTTAF